MSFFGNTRCKTTVLCNSFVVYDFFLSWLSRQVHWQNRKSFTKGQLNMLRLIITVLFTNIWTTTQLVTNIYLILHICIHHYFASSSPIQKSNLRTARINLVQDNTDNTEIIDRNWIKIAIFVLFKGALKIKELNRILNSGLKVSKKLQLF